MLTIDEVEADISVGAPHYIHPELRLWGAVLRLGLQDAAGYRRDMGRDGVCGNPDYRTANRWLFSDSEAPCSFCWVCSQFGWQPDQVRDAFLRNWRSLLCREVKNNFKEEE